MNKLPMRQSVPSAYLALLATLIFAIPFALVVTKFFPLAAVVTRSFDGQMLSSVLEHVVLSLMRAPPREY